MPEQAMEPGVDHAPKRDAAPPSTSARTQRQRNTERLQQQQDQHTLESAARAAVHAASDVVKNSSMRMIATAPESYREPLQLLHAALTGRRNNEPVPGVQRPAMLDEAIVGLRPAIDLVRKDNAAWLQEELIEPIQSRRFSVDVAAASERVERSTKIGNQVLDFKAEGDPRAEAAALRAGLPQLVESLTMANEIIVRFNEANIEAAVSSMMKSNMPKQYRHLTKLVQLHTVLETAGSLLTLTDEEFHKKLVSVKDVYEGVNTYTELVKAVTGVAGGAVAVAAGAVSLAAKLSGDAQLVARASGFAKVTSMTVSHVLSIIGVVQGLAKALDPSASRQDRIEGLVDAATTAGWLVRNSEKLRGGVVGPAALAVAAGYYEFKHALLLYWGAAHGLTTGLMGLAYETLGRNGDAIARSSDSLMKARALVDQEDDPREKRALERVVTLHAEQLGKEVDDLIAHTTPISPAAGVAREPAAYPILREALAPLKAYKGGREPDKAARAGQAALERLYWIFAHREEITLAAARYLNLRTAEEYVRLKELEKAKKGKKDEAR